MNKLPVPNSLDLWREDPGWPVDVDIILDTYWHFRQHHILPRAGGLLDQDPYIIEAFRLLDMEVEWNKQNEPKRGNLPNFTDMMAQRRAHLRGEDD